MISVSEALEQLFALARPVGVEEVPLADAAGRVLAAPVAAKRTQPPFAASAMDGYAIIGVEAEPDAMFKVVGESAAGHGYQGRLRAGQAVRIFTGAPVPDGATRVIIQEDVDRSGDMITLRKNLDEGMHIRPAGGDFSEGAVMDAPRVLTPRDIALAAAMNLPALPVRQRPVVALIATGDELVMPGETPGPDQIIASNSFGLKAMMEAAGAEVRMLPIAKDRVGSLTTVFELAEGADLIVTIGGASVGDHDLVADVAADLGLDRSFYKIAMRPGKPLMAGRMGDAAMVGLPGNPVSAMVCGQIFLLPLLRVMMGFAPAPAPRMRGVLAAPTGPNGPREHYMRARMTDAGLVIADNQDSSLLSVLAQSDALVVRTPNDGPLDIGAEVEYLPL